MGEIQAVAWADGAVRLLDQTRLPQEERELQITDYRDLAAAIRDLRVRGAPAIGIAAAYGVVLAARSIQTADRETFLARLREATDVLAATRPTAVNLFWALRRMAAVAEAAPDPEAARHALLEEALRIHREDVAANRAMGRHGAALIPDGATVLTHCNTGALATGGYGTALGVVRAAVAAGKRVRVLVDETRPLLQGARLTAWELQREGIPATLMVDGAAGSMMRRGLVACVLVGADRIAANGDVANKIGTYALAVLAREHGLPFYVAAPASSVDLSLASGDGIPIEERRPEEVTHVAGVPVAPAGVDVANPAFDVTPAAYVTAIITERGVARPPYGASLAALCSAEAAGRPAAAG
ncbi:MAG TPA: S-methyl-5-thioribose-1-phosphate isomerase [Dehalococcoidia bacterium]